VEKDLFSICLETERESQPPASRWDNRNVGVRTVKRGQLKKVFAFADFERDHWVAHIASKVKPDSRVLDVGAGPCRYRELFAHCDYKSQDFCQHEGSTVGSLADKGIWSYGDIDYVSDATAIPVEDASFDVILCTEVLEHVPEPSKVLLECGRILRNGGLLILSAPLTSGLHQEPHHYFGGFTPYWYERELKSAGFESIDVQPNGGFFKHYGQETQRFSALLDPRRTRGLARLVVTPFWLLTLPLFRVIMPLACHGLDRLDTHRGFTVGYHVTANRSDRGRP
jgi:SAM-dependent methyltransferase